MGKTILIIEDDEAILEVLKNILTGEGYTIICPKTEAAIYSAARDSSPILIFLDIWLSGLDGGKIAQILKKDEMTKDIPLILMSASNETETLSQSVKAEGFLLKPFTIEELLSVVKKYNKQ